MRILRERCSCTQTQIMGGTETDLLREVPFTNNEKGKYLFEPLH